MSEDLAVFGSNQGCFADSVQDSGRFGTEALARASALARPNKAWELHGGARPRGGCRAARHVHHRRCQGPHGGQRDPCDQDQVIHTVEQIADATLLRPALLLEAYAGLVPSACWSGRQIVAIFCRGGAMAIVALVFGVAVCGVPLSVL